MNKRQLWSEADKVRLTALWAGGKPIRVIAKLLGVSKNAAVGQAHRMGLAKRPSPIQSLPEQASQAEARRLARAGHGLNEIARLAGVSPWYAKCAIKAAKANRAPWPAVPEVAALPVMHALPALPELPDHAPPPIAPPVRDHAPVSWPLFTAPCCWPLGDPGTKSFRYCDERTQRGSPYCGEHHKLAYVPRPREDAAA